MLLLLAVLSLIVPGGFCGATTTDRDPIVLNPTKYTLIFDTPDFIINISTKFHDDNSETSADSFAKDFDYKNFSTSSPFVTYFVKTNQSRTLKFNITMSPLEDNNTGNTILYLITYRRPGSPLDQKPIIDKYNNNVISFLFNSSASVKQELITINMQIDNADIYKASAGKYASQIILTVGVEE